MMQQPHSSLPLSQLFGLIIPGKEVITSFTQADPTGTKYTLTIPFPVQPNPNDNVITSISELVFFLLPNITLPPNSGAMIYWSASAAETPNCDNHASSSSFELLGALTTTQTSSILRTGWSTNEPLQNLLASLSSKTDSYVSITFGISIEPLDNVNNVQQPIVEKNMNQHKNIAHKIALDLFNYLQSFDDTQQNANGWMNVPTNIFDRWFKRFEMKIGRDPNFFMNCSKE